MVKDQNAIELVEAKWSDPEVSKTLMYFSQKLKLENCVQLVGTLPKSFTKNKIRIMHPIDYFLKGD